MRKSKKCLATAMSVVLVTTMSIGGMATKVSAGEDIGDCGYNLSSSVGGSIEGGTYTLSINVIDKNDPTERDMINYYYDESENVDAFPWKDYRGDIQIIEIGDGVETISSDAFRNMPNLKEVTIPTSIYYIGKNAFLNCNSLKDIYYEGNKNEWDDLLAMSTQAEINFDAVNVHLLGGRGISFDPSDKVFTINTLAPTPGKEYEDVSAYTTIVTDNVPGLFGDDKYSEGVIQYWKDDSNCGIDVYERWTERVMSESQFVQSFSNNARYSYMLAFDMTH